MSMRRGFTLVELLVTLAILIIAITLVVVDFRKVNEREFLKQAALDTVVAMQQYQGRSIGNQQSAGTVLRTTSYGFRFNRSSGVIDIGAFSDDPSFAPICGTNPGWVAAAEANLNLHPNVTVERIWVGNITQSSSEVATTTVNFPFQTGRPETTQSANCLQNPAIWPVTIAFRNIRIGQCWQVRLQSNGLITQNPVACP